MTVQRPCVVVFDSEAEICKFLEEVLGREGYEVPPIRTFDSFGLGFFEDVLTVYHPSVVITSSHHLEKALAAANESQERPHIILFTGLSVDRLPTGVHTVLAKPVGTDAIVAAVRRGFDSRTGVNS